MKSIKYIIQIIIMLAACNCLAQQYQLIGTCEGCEAIFEYGERKLSAVDTLIDFDHQGPKLKVSGIVYEKDGTTPAENVVLYIYHTNQNGIYPTKGDENGWAKRHGYIRGWVKTDNEGKYTFYTLKPGTYPSRNEPAHIHITVLEPNGKYYWIDSYYFSDDSLLTDKDKNSTSIRGGGTNILYLKKENDLLIGNRNIILGKNIPGY